MSKRNWARCLMVMFLWGAAMLVAPAAAAQGAEVEKLLELLVKKNVITQEEATALREEIVQEKVVQQAQAAVEKQNQAAQVKDQTVAASRPLRLSGWAQGRFSSTAGTKNSMELRRARLDLRGNITDKIAYRMQADFVRSPVLLDAYVDFTHLSFAKLRVGQFKVPFSQENLISSKDLITIERSLVVNTFAPGRDTGNNGRDIGFMVEGNIARGDGKPLFDYSVGLFNGAGINRRDDNHRKDAAVRLVTHLARGIRLGGAYYNGQNGPTQTDKERAMGEFSFVRQNLLVQGEYIWGRDAAVHRRGSYTTLAYKFRPQWQGVFRFEEFNPNRRVANDETRTYVMGVNWLLNDYVKFQANYNVGDEAFRSKLNHTFLTQLQFAF